MVDGGETMDVATGARGILAVGIDLKMSPVTYATAAWYLQRFCASAAPSAPVPEVVMTALWLAAKSLDDSRRLREIVNSWEALNSKGEVSLMNMEEYWTLRDRLLVHESTLLRTLC